MNAEMFQELSEASDSSHSDTFAPGRDRVFRHTGDAASEPACRSRSSPAWSALV